MERKLGTALWRRQHLKSAFRREDFNSTRCAHIPVGGWSQIFLLHFNRPPYFAWPTISPFSTRLTSFIILNAISHKSPEELCDTNHLQPVSTLKVLCISLLQPSKATSTVFARLSSTLIDQEILEGRNLYHSHLSLDLIKCSVQWVT